MKKKVNSDGGVAAVTAMVSQMKVVVEILIANFSHICHGHLDQELGGFTGEGGQYHEDGHC